MRPTSKSITPAVSTCLLFLSFFISRYGTRHTPAKECSLFSIITVKSVSLATRVSSSRKKKKRKEIIRTRSRSSALQTCFRTLISSGGTIVSVPASHSHRIRALFASVSIPFPVARADRATYRPKTMTALEASSPFREARRCERVVIERRCRARQSRFVQRMFLSRFNVTGAQGHASFPVPSLAETPHRSRVSGKEAARTLLAKTDL